MEATDQGVVTDSHVEGIPIVEGGEQFTTYTNPLVEQPPAVETTFHFPMEGHADSPTETEYVPNAPFWRTSMGQSLSKFEITRPSFVNPPIGASLDEEMYRRFQLSFECLQNIHDNLEKIISTPILHK